MKKQILIVFTGPLELGGIERSLLGLLDAIDYDRYDVDLFLYGHHGALFSEINSNANLLPEIKELSYLRESFSSKLKHGCFYSAILRCRDAFLGIFTQVDHDKTWNHIMRRCTDPIQKEYDLAIGFFRPFELIIEKVKAKRKVGWIHTDYRYAGENPVSVETDYSRLDTIVAVSDACAESFASLFPHLQDRLVTIENIISVNHVKQEAKEEISSNEMQEQGAFKLLTVGRFSHPKNMDNIPDICKRIRKASIDVIWYLIGYGPDEAKIKERIEETGMQDYVVILGKKDNPYPYIKACDLYVQPSRYEGKSVAVREAQMLGKPVVITDYPTSGSQLENGVDGIIVPMDNEGCANGIIALLRDLKKMEELAHCCSQRDYTNASEIEKIYRMMEC